MGFWNFVQWLRGCTTPVWITVHWFSALNESSLISENFDKRHRGEKVSFGYRSCFLRQNSDLHLSGMKNSNMTSSLLSKDFLNKPLGFCIFRDMMPTIQLFCNAQCGYYQNIYKLSLSVQINTFTCINEFFLVLHLETAYIQHVTNWETQVNPASTFHLSRLDWQVLPRFREDTLSFTFKNVTFKNYVLCRYSKSKTCFFKPPELTAETSQFCFHWKNCHVSYFH